MTSKGQQPLEISSNRASHSSAPDGFDRTNCASAGTQGSEGSSVDRSSLCSYNSLSSLESVQEETATLSAFRTRINAALHAPGGSLESAAMWTRKRKLEQIIKSLDDSQPGYPKVSAFENCDPSFLIYRKFGRLRNRMLLRYQDELVEKEQELEMLDKWTFGRDPQSLGSRRRESALGATRCKELVKEIAEKLAEYDDLLLRTQKIQSIKRPTKRDQISLYNLIHHTRSLTQPETDWIRCGDDLAALADDQMGGWFKGFLEDIMKSISTRATIYFFRTKEQRLQSGNTLISLVSAERLDNLLRAIITVIATILLLLPVFILWKIQDHSGYQILVIFVFTLVFSASCSIVTNAKRQEVFAATAAYCAVLVVFLGNDSSTRSTL